MPGRSWAARACSAAPRPPACGSRTASACVTDGPFAETKEQLGGFYVLDCKDLDEALDWAAKRSQRRERRVDRDPPGDGLRGRYEDPQAASQGAASSSSTATVDRLFRQRVGAGGRDPDPHPRRLRPRRGGGAGGVRGRAGALAARRAAGQPGRLDRAHGAQPRDRPPAPRAPLRGEAARAGAAHARTARRPAGDVAARRPAAAVLHLLPPGAGARGARGADPAHARRAVDARGRARLPGRRERDAAAPRAGQAQDPRRRHPLRGAARPRAAGPAALGARRALPDLQRGLPRHAARTRSCAASCATRRSGSGGCCAS